MNIRTSNSKRWRCFVAGMICFFGSFSASLRAAEVSGMQYGRWVLASSPYVVTGDVVIPVGRTLTVEPGVVVKFAGYYSFKIEGILRAIGSPINRIVFTSSRDREFEEVDAASPTTDDWIGIEFTDSSNDDQSRLENCLIRYCTKPLRFNQVFPKSVEGITISDCSGRVIDINGQLVPFQDGAEQDYGEFFQSSTGSKTSSPQPAGTESVNPAGEEVIPELDLSEMGMESFFELHGYFDTVFEVENGDEEGQKISDFRLGHFNIVSNFTFSERAFALAEIEYTEGGFDEEAEAEEHETAETPISLEQAWLQLKLTDHLNLRAGKFLTPYGIYNLIRNTTPAFLFTELAPSIYGSHPNASGEEDLDFPEILAGVQVNGTLPLESGAVDYYGYVSNGRGPTPFEEDNNSNKAVGFRLRYSDGLDRFKIGASFFRGKNGNDANTLQQLAAADLELNLGNLKLQAEGSLNQFDRLDSAGVNLGTHRKALGYYAVGSYAIAGRFQPFVRFDRYDPDNEFDDDAENEVSVGININVMKDVFFKLENHFETGQAEDFESLEHLQISIAAGF